MSDRSHETATHSTVLSPPHSASGAREAKEDSEEQLTLSRDNPLSEFIRMQNGNISSMSPERFEQSYLAHLASSRPPSGSDKLPRAGIDTENTRVDGLYVDHIVLKFTTLSENCSETPSFFVSTRGASVGQDASNEISIPSDNRLAPVGHCKIEYLNGCFHILDEGYDFSASLRIGVGAQQMPWTLTAQARFSAGNSIFKSNGQDGDGNLVVDIIEGPLKGTTKLVSREVGATIGRSSDNQISVPDRELSRKHSRISFDAASGQFLISDLGSTNGTYIQLVGPYSGRYRLSLNDHILVGRTGFSINRFDYGLSEEIGHRQSMEDACAIVQHLNVPQLNVSRDISPQSFFAVFDGHGGAEASLYLSEHLHVNIAASLALKSAQLIESVGPYPNQSLSSTGIGLDGPSFQNVVVHSESQTLDRFDRIVVKSLVETFLKTDTDFLNSSSSANHGSTATTVLILGNRLYCSNAGDSRTVLCRNFSPIALSIDHKPARPDEAQRIRDAGGFVINNRVMGELAVSRAFGDSEFKKGIQSMIGGDGGDFAEAGDNVDQPLVISEPEIQVTTITKDDQFVLLACDGLFDVFTCEDVVAFVRENMETHQDAQKCCQNLTYEAIRKRNSRDNVSVILVILNKWY